MDVLRLQIPFFPDFQYFTAFFLNFEQRFDLYLLFSGTVYKVRTPPKLLLLDTDRLMVFLSFVLPVTVSPGC